MITPGANAKESQWSAKIPWRNILLILCLWFFADGALAQSNAGANPTPTPAPKRRTFDQFDLSDGIRIGSSTNRGRANSAPTVTEFVDQSTYEGIARMVRYAKSIESEYRSTEGVTVDPSDYFEPYRVLSRKMPALLRISEMFRAGLLDQPVLTNPANVALLNQNQQIISEMMMIVNSTEAQLARNQRSSCQSPKNTERRHPQWRSDRC